MMPLLERLLRIRNGKPSGDRVAGGQLAAVDVASGRLEPELCRAQMSLPRQSISMATEGKILSDLSTHT